MKTKFKLSVSISPEERKVLVEAERILQDICLVFDEHGQCDTCPMHAICYEQLKECAALHNILYNAYNALNIEEE